MSADGASAEFSEFFEHHHVGLSRLAYLLTGEPDGADDLAADAMVVMWHRWPEVRRAGSPLAYARGTVANLARERARTAVRERRRIRLFWARTEPAHGPDIAATVTVRTALERLPFRKRACVVMRYAFDMSEKEVAQALGIAVGTVKSQTSKGVAELRRLLDPMAAEQLVARSTR
ncbi:SigE family RNA polymerase sigma factor [Streptomyces sp. ms191]|uniref:SigE family RNA polymerase sigma factor n=1 Tax=Streptomyces sp. ms191 TaxID=1827978 RepID=UPI0011CD3A47|nr:SigE family RNA polymerase sigma factor [Streptomyces sp. ms191]TXS33034.1 SigE family RNA polymerase sigma factor [Streptomyces sp. ms191]